MKNNRITDTYHVNNASSQIKKRNTERYTNFEVEINRLYKIDEVVVI